MTGVPGRAGLPGAAPAPHAPRDAMAWGLALFNRLAQSPRLDRLGLRPKAERTAYHATKTGLEAAAALSRTFAAAGRLGSPLRQPGAPKPDLFDLTPTDDQQMLVDVVREFAAERIRPAASDADRACRTPDDLIATAVELGIWQMAVPEQLGGFSEHRSAVTGVLVAEALAGGDLGLAVAVLAPAAVVTALSLWGDADQQDAYLSGFMGDDPPRAALAVSEPRPLFDPFALTTRAVRRGDGYRLDGVKSLVPAAGRAELFVVAATVTDPAPGERAGPALFLVESGSAGLRVRPEPAMGLRAAETGRLHLEAVPVPGSARIGTAQDNPYPECIRLSRLGWCALAVGTGQAVLDYVVPYVNERVAFGEPVSHRQGVAFMVADLATELDGMRLATYRAASRAEQGLDFARETALARRLCSDYGMTIGSDGVQLLGGHGYVKEHPVERWYRDLRAIGLSEGVVLV